MCRLLNPSLCETRFYSVRIPQKDRLETDSRRRESTKFPLILTGWLLKKVEENNNTTTMKKTLSGENRMTTKPKETLPKKQQDISILCFFQRKKRKSSATRCRTRQSKRKCGRFTFWTKIPFPAFPTWWPRENQRRKTMRELGEDDHGIKCCIFPMACHYVLCCVLIVYPGLLNHGKPNRDYKDELEPNPQKQIQIQCRLKLYLRWTRTNCFINISCARQNSFSLQRMLHKFLIYATFFKN